MPKHLATYPELPFSKYLEQSSAITPPFPNWEKSFISGHESTLFKVHYLDDKQNEKRIWARSEFLPDAEGPPGHIHGGASSALMDEALGILVWRKGYAGVTQTLTLNYIRPLPLSLKAMIPLTIIEITDRKVHVVGEVRRAAAG